MLRGLLIAAAILFAGWVVAIGALVITGRKTQGRGLAASLPYLIILFRGLLQDQRVPRSSKALLVFAVVWIASPIDLVPEFIPVLGPLDDAVVAALVLRHVVRRTDRAVLEEHWRGSPAFLDRVLPRA